MDECLLEDLLAILEGPLYHNRQCHCQHLLELAKHITEWKTLAPWLGFEATAVEDLDRNRFDEEGKRQAMLRRWKEVNGCMATYGHLATLLVKSDRRNLAELVLKLSKKDPGLLPKPIQNYSGFSNHSSQHSSSFHTPETGTPRRPPSLYSTPPVSPCRSAQQTTASSEHSSDASGGLLVTSNPSVFPAQTHHHQMLVESMSIGGQQQQQQPQGVHQQQSLQLPPGIQTSTTDPHWYKGAMIAPEPTPLVPHGFCNRVTSVCDMASLPTAYITEIMQLNHRIQRLEFERQASRERHDLELTLMKKAHESEKQLWGRQLDEAHTNAKTFELMVQRRVQVERELYGSIGQEETDFPDGVDTDTITGSASLSRGDSKNHEYYTAKSYVCQEEWKATLEYSKRYVENGHSCGGDTVREGTSIAAEESRVVVRRVCRQITLCLEEKELRYQAKARTELATQHLKFLEANNRLTEVVSQSLESLNTTASSTTTASKDHEGLVQDLRWIQSNLEKCRLARHASWP